MDVSSVLLSLTLAFAILGQLLAHFIPDHKRYPYSQNPYSHGYFMTNLACPIRGTYRCCGEDWCIRLNQVCDRYRDCLEGEDEENCNYCCPDRWVAFQGSCYFFGTTEYDQQGAANACSQMDSSLVAIETSTENEFLQTFVSGHDFAGWWIGMERDEHGDLRWTSTGMVPDFDDWLSGHPGSHDCVGFNSGQGNQWNTGGCGNQAPPICERLP